MNGGKCNLDAWGAHKPEDCKSNQLKAQKEEKKDPRGKKKGNVP
jgi:hypothetical protein